MNASLRVALAFFALSGNALLGANRFVQAGAPAPDREWSRTDYEALSVLLQRKESPLPNLADPDGAAIFRRLVDVENFSLFYNRTIPLDQRLPSFLAMQGSANTVLKAYIAEANRGADLHQEVALLAAFTLRTTVVALDLVDEFLPTIQRDEKYEIRMQGLKQMRGAFPTVYLGLEQSLSETAVYTADDLGVMILDLHETTPRLKAIFSADFQTEMRIRFEKRRVEFPREADKKLIDAVINELAEP